MEGKERRITEMAQEMEEPIFQAQRETFWIAARRSLESSLPWLWKSLSSLVAARLTSGALSIAQVTMSLGVAPGLFCTGFWLRTDQAYASAALVFAVTDREPQFQPANRSFIDGRGDLQISTPTSLTRRSPQDFLTIWRNTDTSAPSHPQM